MTSQQLFADGISEITVSGGVVRVQFFVGSRKSNDATLERQPVFGLAMPIEGYANSVQAMQQLLEKMVADGLLRPVPAK